MFGNISDNERDLYNDISNLEKNARRQDASHYREITRLRRLLRIQQDTVECMERGDEVPYTHSQRNEPLAKAFEDIAAEISQLVETRRRTKTRSCRGCKT